MKQSTLALLALAVAACKEDDPTGSVDAPNADAEVIVDAPIVDAPTTDANPACSPLQSDYEPRENNSAGDEWPVCVSDQDEYVNVDPNVSTIARIAAFEQMAALLFTGAAPSNQAFLDARVAYSQANGLESRMVRREDEHYPAAPMACNALPDPSMYPDRCVGPARLQPLVLSALSLGATDADPAVRRLAAARVEAGLLWFLYVSVYKELTTCAVTPVDCDSGWAYYGGGDQRDGGLGLARYVRGLELEAHDRSFDGVLAVRCWRDLDDPATASDDATYAPLRVLGLAQVDRGLLRGVALIVRARLQVMAAAAPADAGYHWEMIRHLGPVLLREAGVRDPGRAATLSAQLALTDAAAVDEAAMIAALDAIFPCP